MYRILTIAAVTTLVSPLACADEPETEYKRQLTDLRKDYAAKVDLLKSSFEAEAADLKKLALKKLENARKHWKSSDNEDALKQALKFDRRWKNLNKQALPSLVPVSSSRRQMQRKINGLQSELDRCLGINTQLISNPGCEEIDQSGAVASWKVEQGSWAPREAKQAEGKYLFFAEQSSRAVLAQKVDISAAAELADRSTLSFTATTKLWCLAQKPADSGELGVELLDAKGKVLGKFATGQARSKNAWKKLELTAPIAQGTRYITVKLLAYRTGPRGSKQNDAQFDQVSLILNRVTKESR